MIDIIMVPGKVWTTEKLAQLITKVQKRTEENHSKGNLQFAIITKMYATKEDGSETATVGLFTSEEIAQAFSKGEASASWHGTANVFMTENGELAFLIDDINLARLLDEKDKANAVLKKIQSKLNDEEQKLLGIKGDKS